MDSSAAEDQGPRTKVRLIRKTRPRSLALSELRRAVLDPCPPNPCSYTDSRVATDKEAVALDLAARHFRAARLAGGKRQPRREGGAMARRPERTASATARTARDGTRRQR